VEIIRRHFSSIDSTNNWAKQHLEKLERRGITLVTANCQTAGRGRFKRSWHSPPDQNIYATYCFFVEKVNVGHLPQIMALAAAKLLQELGFQPKLKWPNDLLLSGKKVAGILCETLPLPDTLAIILGIGLNVNMPPEQLQLIDRPATSLLAEDGHTRDVETLLNTLSTHFLNYLQLFLDEGFSPFLAAYKKQLIHRPGAALTIQDGQTVWKGRFAAIRPDGSLVLELPSGELRPFVAGEIRRSGFG
jgi:BirA family transcriptional regulator, biotin operon repressor / biotin---[acetyl-CoA-carboxylase] ligase